MAKEWPRPRLNSRPIQSHCRTNEAIYTGKALDYKAQKLIAIGINAATSDDRATKKQMMSGMKELGITKDEIVDVMRVVLLTSGMPPFTKGMKILYEILEK